MLDANRWLRLRLWAHVHGREVDVVRHVLVVAQQQAVHFVGHNVHVVVDKSLQAG